MLKSFMYCVLIQASWLSYSVTLGKPLAFLSLSFLLYRVVVRLNKIAITKLEALAI